MRLETRVWSKGSARGAGPQKQRRSVYVRLGVVAEDTPLCQHGLAMCRCDECGVYFAGHPGQPPHRCGEYVASCADDVPRHADGRVR